MVQWLQDNRALVLLVCLPLMGYAGYLYLRAWNSHRLAQAAEQRRRRQRGKSSSKSGKPAASPLPRTTSIRGEQSDLLEQVGTGQEADEAASHSDAGDQQHRDKGYQSTHIIRTQAAGDSDTPPRPSEIIRQLQDRQPARAILDEVEQRDEAELAGRESSESEVQRDDYSTTDQFRTTRQLQMPPSQQGDSDTATASEDATTEPISGDTGAGTTARPETDQWRADQAHLRELADAGRRSSAPMPEEPVGKRFHRGYQPAGRDLVSALEKARRLEELGLHVGISPADLERAQERLDEAGRRSNSAIAEVLDEQQQERLHELGLTAEEPAAASGAEDGKRLVTAELSQILDRLDDALGDEEQADEAGADGSAAKETTGQPSDDDSDASQPAAAVTAEGDTEDRTPTDPPDETAAVDPDDAPELLSDADLDEQTQPAQSDTAADQVTDEEDRTPTVPAASNTAPPVQESADTTPPADETRADQPTESDKRRPIDDLPAWARADTFDEDLPDSSHDQDRDGDDDSETGKQQNLFD